MVQFGWLLRCGSAVVVGILLPSPAIADVTVRLVTNGSPYIELNGIPADVIAALVGDGANQTGPRILTLHVVSNAKQSALPVIGDYSVVRGSLIFTPRFPLKPGLKYSAVFDPAGLPRESAQHMNRVEASVSLPALPRGKATAVSAIYPSADVLPENQLKFYIQFSAPMSRGDSYRHVRLMDDKDAPVDAPYLELAEELWDESCTRLTLLFDPGRVKRDLKPHQEVGGALVEGRTYTLLIDDHWPDANGSHLGTKFRKRFSVTKPDTRQPNPNHWNVTPPPAGTRDPLVVTFDESLDHSMLQHVIDVKDVNSGIKVGQATIDRNETRWTFHPATTWRAGVYQLLVDPSLEDRAGNSIERPFEVHRPSDLPAKTPPRAIEFTIQPN